MTATQRKRQVDKTQKRGAGLKGVKGIPLDHWAHCRIALGSRFSRDIILDMLVTLEMQQKQLHHPCTPFVQNNSNHLDLSRSSGNHVESSIVEKIAYYYSPDLLEKVLETPWSTLSDQYWPNTAFCVFFLQIEPDLQVSAAGKQQSLKGLFVCYRMFSKNLHTRLLTYPVSPFEWLL